MDRHAARFHLAVLAGVAAVVTAVLVSRPRGHAARAAEGTETGEPLADFCAPGLAPIAGGCFAAPADARGAPLIVYLHGRFSPETEPEERARQARVAALGTARGFAVLALRGAQGQCTDPALADWWCWPSNERNADDGPRFVEAWAPALEEAERRVGPGRRLLLGFSNGGYFAALIATRALHAFDAVAIAHAGPVEPTRALGPTPPILLETADDDPSNEEVLRLDAELDAIRWPHELFARDGGHELPEADVAAALTFFERTAAERLPLRPPISTRPPRRSPPDASADAPPDATADSTSDSTFDASPDAPSAREDQEAGAGDEEVQDDDRE